MVPGATTDARVQAIEAEGARVEHVQGDYDAAVVRAASLADDAPPGHRRHLVARLRGGPPPRRRGLRDDLRRARRAARRAAGGPRRRPHRRGLARRRRRPPLPRDARASARGWSGSSRSTPPARWPRRGPGSRSRSTASSLGHGRPELPDAVGRRVAAGRRGLRRLLRRRRRHVLEGIRRLAAERPRPRRLCGRRRRRPDRAAGRSAPTARRWTCPSTRPPCSSSPRA